MKKSSLQAQLAESKAEIARLKECLSTGTPTIHKDLSLNSLVPTWSGSESAITLAEFMEKIDSAAKLGRWHSSDCLRIPERTLADPAMSFYNTCLEIHAEDATWEKFKAFRERFSPHRSVSFMRLQAAKTGKK